MSIIKHSQLFKTPIFMVKPVFLCGKAGILHTKSEQGMNTAYCLFHRPEYRTEKGYTTPFIKLINCCGSHHISWVNQRKWPKIKKNKNVYS